jgi:hypothetical protein
MKKTIVGLMFAASLGSVHAADVTFSAGVNRGADENMGAVAIGTTMYRFRLDAKVAHTIDTSTSIGLGVGREVKLWALTVTPQVGLAYAEADSKAQKSGGIVTTGVNVSYPIMKNVAVTFDIGRQWDMQDRTNFEGTVITAGLRTSF